MARYSCAIPAAASWYRRWSAVCSVKNRISAIGLLKPHYDPLSPVNLYLSRLGHLLYFIRRIAMPRLVLPTVLGSQPGLQIGILFPGRAQWRRAGLRII